MTTSRTFIAVAALVAASNLRAQEACIGPGVALGVTAYQCASCGQKRDGARSTWTFGAEPVVTEVTNWSALMAGDVIQAVNGKPITTVEGARDFTYPPMQMQTEASRIGELSLRRTTARPIGGEVQVRVRRNGQSTVISTGSRCEEQTTWMVSSDITVDSGRAAGGGARGGGAGRGARAAGGGAGGGRARGGGTAGELAVLVDSLTGTLGRDRVRIRGALSRDSSAPIEFRRDPVLAARMMPELEDLRRSFERTGRFGIALACAPSCSKLVMDGFEYWKYDAPPTIAEVRNNSPAQRTGLQVGDIVIAIDGWALTTDEGAQRFVRSATDSTSIALTIRRNGQDLRFVLSASPGRGGGGGRGGARGRGGPPQ